MFKHILIATDGSELAQEAETVGLTLAAALNARVTAVTATKPWDALSISALVERGLRNPVADYDEIAAASANRIRRARLAGAPAQSHRCIVNCGLRA